MAGIPNCKAFFTNSLFPSKSSEMRPGARSDPAAGVPILPMLDPITVITNANAGNRKTAVAAAQLIEQFRRAGLAVVVIEAANGKELLAAARSAVERGARTVVAGGGDGTINAVASSLVGTDCRLGVLPMGTLNHFAKDLKIPASIDEAIATIVAGHVIQVDVGEVNGRPFLNNSSLGLYPNIVRDREQQQRRLGRGKWLAFFWATVTALRRYPFLSARLEVDGKPHVRRTPFIFIGNNKYSMSGFTLGSRTELNRGILSLYVAQRTSRFGLLRLAVRSLFGRLRQARDFDEILASDITVETRHRLLPVATDGEVTWMQAPLRYRIRPRALNVLVPASTASAMVSGTGQLSTTGS